MKKMNLFTGLRDFLILWSSQTVSSLGTAMTNFALIIWVYGQQGTVSSITLLTICTFLPTILFRFIAGTIADKWDKKRIMLLADLMAACGTVTVFVLYSFSALEVWHLYIVNFLLSFMDAFQSPATYVALSPALGSILLAFGGLQLVLVIDLLSFAVAFITLLVFIKLPDVVRTAEIAQESFLKSCMTGIHYLRKHEVLLRMILFFSIINFLAKLGGDGMISAFVLGKTSGNQQALGMTESATALGILTGSILVTLMPPAKNKVKVIFVCCAFTFLVGNVGLSLTPSLPFWVIIQFASYIPVVILGANLTAAMRDQVPVELQGRVFSARDTLQNSSIPLGLFLGGLLADHVFEPFMSASSPVQQALSLFFGTGKGAGIGMIFFIVGIAGFIISIVAMKNPLYQNLNQKQ